MSSAALHLYEQLSEATDDKSRAKIIAEAFSQLEDRYPHLKEVATQSHVRESELRLQKEIREVEVKIKEAEGRLQKEIRETEGRLQKEIREVEVKIKEVEAKLQKEMREIEVNLRKDIHQIDVKIKDSEIRLTQAIHRQTLWMIGSVGTVVAAIRLLEWVLTRLS